MKKKKYDAVEEMRSIRERLRKEFEKNPTARKKRLEKIHVKYNMNTGKNYPLAVNENVQPYSSKKSK